MVKLKDILKEINEGILFSDGKYKFSPQNTPNDILIYDPGVITRKNTSIFYSFKINPNLESGEEFKLAADAIKNLDNTVDFNTLEEPIKDGIKRSMADNQPDIIYYLGSSKGLSSLLGDIAQEVYPKVKVLPLNKKTFPSWENMLVDNYKSLVKDPKYLSALEKEAQRMWSQEGGKIKSSEYTPRFRQYFKSKYELDNILNTNKILFLDDNVQKGIDLGLIETLLSNKQCFFYTPMLLPLEGSKVSPKQKASKVIKIGLTKRDLKMDDMFKTFTQEGEKRLYISFKHPKFKDLLSKFFIEKNSINHPTLGRFHRFTNPNIVTKNDIIPID